MRSLYCCFSLMLLVLLVVLSLFDNVQANKKKKHHDKNEPDCSKMPQDCCKDWKIVTDPDNYERDTGCKVKCCENMARKRMANKDLRQIIEEEANFGELYRCLSALLQNLFWSRFGIPENCCTVPQIQARGICPNSTTSPSMAPTKWPSTMRPASTTGPAWTNVTASTAKPMRT